MAAARPWFARLPVLAGIGVSLALAGLILATPIPGMGQLREQALDRLMLARPAAVPREIVVVDIDRRSDGTTGTWSRARTAAMVGRLAAAGAAVVAFDLAFSGSCDAAAPENRTLAAALAEVPVVLGFLLTDLGKTQPAPRPPVAVRQPVAVPDLWFADAAEGACPEFAARAAGAAAMSLAGDSDARIRTAPAVVAIGGAPYPGLAIEAVRLGRGWSIPVLGGDPPTLEIGDLTLPLDAAASLRFRPTGPEVWAQRTVSAIDVADGKVPAARLADAIVFVGSSQPEAGGLRATAATPLAPSVQIHADVASGLVAGFVPFRDGRAPLAEALFAGLAGSLVALAAARLRPIAALAAAAGAALAWLAFAALLYATRGMLLDPLYPVVAVVAAYATASLVQYAATRRAEERLRRRFGQHLPPAIVSRFVADPSQLKLESEEREITALFTDIEGFTDTMRRAGPHELIGMLDRYLGGITGIVTRHGGTVDKFVGDAVHAYFNAPLDLADHADKAIACALEILAFAEAFARQPENSRFGFGRTRIGIESGMTVVGDVGAGDKIDYTAHGNAVNLASRLEAANKRLGTAICIGPGTRALASVQLTSLGEIDIGGFGRLEVFTPVVLDQRPTLA